jgi:hypothetical protein
LLSTGLACQGLAKQVSNCVLFKSGSSPLDIFALPSFASSPSAQPGKSSLARSLRISKIRRMTPKEQQAIEYVQKLKNDHCKNSHLALLIFNMGSGFANSRFECNNPNQTEAAEDARKSIADNLEAGGKPVAILISALGAPFPQLEIFPEFQQNSEFCYKLQQYTNSL